MKPTVLLIDIDGTLLTTSGAGRRAMTQAFTSRFDRDPCDFPFGGMTDRAIVRQGLSGLHTDPSEAAIQEVIDDYLMFLEREVLTSEVRFCAGMEPSLRVMESIPNVAIGLGTGNVRRGASIKISRITPFDRFTFGGFGCDHESRPDLLRIGAERGARQLKAKLEDCRVVVIGDTPKDVSAARAIGAECVAVATGSYSVEQLHACSPTHVFRTLGDSGALSTARLDG